MNIISVILNYNDSERCIELAKKNALFASVSCVLIVDNCSTLAQFEILKSFKFDKVRVIRTDKNGGFGYGNNYAFRYCYENLAFDYIFISNTDTEYDEDFILTCAETVKKNSNIGIVSGAMKGIDGELQNSFWKYATFGDFLKSCFFLYRRKKSLLINEGDCENQFVDVVRGSFMFFNKHALLESGFFDEKIFLYGEETVLCKRMNKAGYKVMVLGNKYYIHNHIQGSNDVRKMIYMNNLMLKSSYYIQKEYNDINAFQKIIGLLFLWWGYLENMIGYTIIYWFKRR